MVRVQAVVQLARLSKRLVDVHQCETGGVGIEKQVAVLQSRVDADIYRGISERLSRNCQRVIAEIEGRGPCPEGLAACGYRTRVLVKDPGA